MLLVPGMVFTIGAADANGDCGTVTIGGVVKAQSDFTGATYTYRP